MFQQTPVSPTHTILNMLLKINMFQLGLVLNMYVHVCIITLCSLIVLMGKKIVCFPI